MAHIQKRTYKSRKTGAVTTTWIGRYTAPDGSERSQRFTRKVDAENWVKSHEGDIVRGQWLDPNRGKVPFRQYAEEWKATRVNLRASTEARDFGYLDRYILPTFGDTDISAIDSLAVEKWLAQITGPGPRAWWDQIQQPDRKRRPVSPATAVKAQQILAKILARAVRDKRIAANPCDDVDLPRIEREEMRFLTTSEVDLLADCIAPRHKALALVGCYGGLRIGELAGLRRGRVDILRNRIDVAEIVIEIGGHLTYGQPKTKAGRRSLTLPRSVTSALEDHLKQFTPAEPDAFVFTAPEGGPLRVPAWRRRQWAPAVDLAGLAPLRPHDMRHTAVALWIASGMSPLEVARRAGHASVSFTLDRYGHLFPDADEAAADKLEQLIAKQQSAR